jgi:hypothetical protein
VIFLKTVGFMYMLYFAEDTLNATLISRSGSIFAGGGGGEDFHFSVVYEILHHSELLRMW